MHSVYVGRGGTTGWQNSELKISSAMSLNEVVNKPASFVSASPHYVIADIDWIQTRYLLVRTSARHTKGKREDMQTISQDPSRKPVSNHHVAIEIPITAISESRRPKGDSHKTAPSRKRKSIGSGLPHAPFEHIDDDADSDVTSVDDYKYVWDDESRT